ncbi:MAG: hypothetical protein R3256_01855 [Thalassovita sp.]|nr:hypothetical protein [Thalassovita sp.]
MHYLRVLLFTAVIANLLIPVPTMSQVAAAGWVSDGEAGTFEFEFTRRLYHESLVSARDWADQNRSESNQTAEFAYGVTLFFGAVEGLIGDFSRYGMSRDDTMGIPFFRLFAPANPAPEAISYSEFRGIFQRFDARLAEARGVLAGIDDPEVTLAFRPMGVRIDLNGDGVYATNERLLPVFNQITDPFSQPDEQYWSNAAGEIDAYVGRLAAGDPEALAQLDTIAPGFAYDRADAAWLAGYTHLLSAFADVLLAHDLERQFDYGILAFFPDAETPYEPLREIYQSLKFNPLFYADSAEIAPIFDVVAVVFGQTFEPASPERLSALRTDLLGMIAQSRRSWNFINAETDNLSGEPSTGFPEWVPGPHQSSLAGFPDVNERVRDAWLHFLDVFEGVLDGELLLPHWRFDKGVNLRKMLEKPKPWSPVLIVQGADVVPYLEDGKIADARALEPVSMILGADFFTYAIWFN